MGRTRAAASRPSWVQNTVAAAVLAGSGCAVDDGTTSSISSNASTCRTTDDSYTPYGPGKSPVGTVADYPWRGIESSYPDGVEDFRGYATAPSETVECADDKQLRSHVDVTAGCLVAVATGGGVYTRGQIHTTPDGAFRVVASGFTSDDPDHVVKWTDQGTEYRFFYAAQTGDTNFPGFKVFARYRTEDDLYVASWRTDGVVQIQRKQCGSYTPLAVIPDFGPPSLRTWHWIRLDAIGDRLDLYLDHQLVLTAHSKVFSWGTVGIRIDSLDGAYVDDWRVFAP